MKNLNCLIDHILYQMFKIILNISHEKKTKIVNGITFTIKTGYYLELLTPETMKLLGRAKNKITNDEYGENVSHLETTEVVIVHCNIVNNDYQQDARVLYTIVLNK